MAVQERHYTADDLWQLSQSDEAKHFELYKGRLIEMSPTGDTHTILASYINYFLMDFVLARQLGDVTSEIGGYKIDEDTVLAPDVGFVRKGRMPQLSGKFIPFAPDLAVEIRSPGDTKIEIYDKVVEYFKYGTRLVWVVYPNSRTIHVYNSATHVTILTLADTLDGSEVLPGFNVPVRDVFQRLAD
jgi:Uma2 family endonuclease